MSSSEVEPAATVPATEGPVSPPPQASPIANLDSPVPVNARKSFAPAGIPQRQPYKPTIWEDTFATRLLAPEGDREVYIRYTVRELFVFLVYLFILCLLTFGVSSTVTYDYTKVMYDLFLDEPIGTESDLGSERTFRSSIHVLDFWLFVTNVLPHYLYWEQLYGTNIGSDPTSHGRPKHFVRFRFRNETTGILYQNTLLGVPRLRQVRVKEQPCPIVRDYRHLSRDECFPPYKKIYEDTGNKKHLWDMDPDIAKKGKPRIYTKNAFRYRTEKQLGGSSHWGKLATYSGGGSVQDLGKTTNISSRVIAELREALWIQRSTRVVFLDFTFYNSNLNLFCIVRLAWEFSPVGGITTSWSIRTLRLLRYVEFKDFALILPCEILFCVFTLYYLIQELFELCRLGCKKYFGDFWSWIDMGIIILSFTCIGFSIYRFILVNQTLADITKNPNTFQDFQFLGFWQTQFNNALSICVFVSWMKVFKYISFNKTMSQLSSTLSRCAKDIFGFAVMFFVCFFAFAQLGFLLFGSQLQDFSTFHDSILTLLRLILGDFNFRQLERANRILGPIYFLCYVFFVFFVLLNMFLAIINDTYSEVKADLQAQRNEFEMADYFRGVWNNFLGCCGKRSTKWDAESAVKLAAADGRITYDELRAHLKLCHFSEVEIEMFLARYELENEHALDDKEILAVLDNLGEGGKRGGEGDEDEENEPTDPEYITRFTELHKRIIDLEGAITRFVGKLKSLKTHLEEKKQEEYKNKIEL